MGPNPPYLLFSVEITHCNVTGVNFTTCKNCVEQVTLFKLHHGAD